jgi:hypothetical protein
VPEALEGVIAVNCGDEGTQVHLTLQHRQAGQEFFKRQLGVSSQSKLDVFIDLSVDREVGIDGSGELRGQIRAGGERVKVTKTSDKGLHTETKTPDLHHTKQLQGTDGYENGRVERH